MISKKWQISTVGEVTQRVTKGTTPTTLGGKFESRGVNFIKVESITEAGTLNHSKLAFIDEQTHTKLARSVLIQNDLLFSIAGTIGKVARVQPHDLPANTNQAVAIIRPDLGKIDRDYLYYCLRDAERIARARTRVVQSVQQNLSLAEVSNIELPLPPMPEQRAIASTLGALDDKIESNRRAIALSEELARSIFVRLFDLSQVSDGVALSNLLTVNPRRILRAGTPATYVGMSSLPEFSAEVYEWEIKEAGSGQRFVSGDVLMARITPCLENGKTSVVDMLQDGEVGWGSTEYVVLSPTGQISTPWIYCLVRDERIREFAIQSMTGTSGRQRFQADRFSQYIITEPAELDLVAFNRVAEPLFARMTQLRDENRRLAALRDVLLPELLSGRLGVGLRSA